MKTSLLTLIFLCLCLFCNAQEKTQYEQFKNIENKADSLKKMLQFEQSIDARMQIVVSDSTYTTNLYEISALYSLSKKPDLAFYYLTKATTLDSSITYLVNPDYIFIYQDSRWSIIRDLQVAKYETTNDKLKNLPLAKMLWEMEMKDQSYYLDFFFLWDIKQDQEGAMKIWQIKDSINKDNLRLLDSIIMVSGWPKISDVGKEGSSAAFLIDYVSHKKFLILDEAKKSNSIQCVVQC